MDSAYHRLQDCVDESRETGVAGLRNDTGQRRLTPIRAVGRSLGAVVTEELRLTHSASEQGCAVALETLLGDAGAPSASFVLYDEPVGKRLFTHLGIEFESLMRLGLPPGEGGEMKGLGVGDLDLASQQLA